MRVALFDFDGTLTRRDTLMPYLRFVVGTPAFLAGVARLAPSLLAYTAGLLRNDRAKEAVLTHFLRGRSIGTLREAGEIFARRTLPRMVRPQALGWLSRHRARGDVCVLVTASLDVYVEPWSKAQGFDAILCSRLETEGNAVTGRLAGGNCYGEAKVRRIKEWLAGRETTEVWAYGDSRGDREMLEFADVAHYRGRMVRGAAAAGRFA